VESLYRLFLLLYPRSFQDAFGAEMTAVFAERAAEYREKGLLPLLRLSVPKLPACSSGAFASRPSLVHLRL
jgi:hypothetical protein